MRSLLPSGRGPLAADGPVVRVLAGGAVEFSLRRRGMRQVLGTASLDDPRRVQAMAARARAGSAAMLDLPSGLLLEQEASLPLAAEPELSRVLLHEMDRLTPFRPAETFWSWAITGRDTANGRLRVRLSLLLKDAVAPLLQDLARAGVTPAGFEVAGPDGAPRRIGLLPPGGDAARHPQAVRLASWACGGLALAAILVPLVQQQWALSAAEERIADLQPRISLVEGLRRRLAASTDGAELFAAEAARSGNAIQALAAVTAALPDDTYLTEFGLRDRKLTLTGRSAAAVRLIGLLAAAPGLANPAFAAPVFRTIGDHGDQFTISADLAP